ncbi:hypothetical protein M406DRAFT_229521, partial [Cryphonectria parasitica EP155]
GHEIPQEIWWLVCQELQKRQDARSLFRAALVCSSWANHALPLLYSIHDSAGTDDVGTTFQGKHMWAGMWRSIILSSIGVTQYPYCLWLKSLGLSDLEQLLGDVASNASLRPRFFEGPMQEFEILSGSKRTRFGKSILEWQKIIEKVGDTVTKFAKEAADEENKIVQLTNLEGANLPTSLLSVWTSRLATLTTLSIRDGSVLTEEVAISIRDHCPAFRELTCFHIQGQTVDENMSAFFRTLKPNSLQSFSVLSSNQIGHDTLDGLMQHSESLRVLALKSLQNTALPFLDLLSNCQYLESLSIESSTPSPPSTWAADGKDPLVVVSAWLQESKHLRKLEIHNLGGASKLLSEVLKSPTLRLRDLETKLVDDDETFYVALGNQTDLESFMFRSNIEVNDQAGLRHDTFIDSICSCKKLNDLNIMQNDHMQLTPEDLGLFQESLPELESLSFDGELLSDAIWTPLMGMTSLTTININGLSVFTYE